MNKIDSARFLKCGLIYFAILFFQPAVNSSYIYAVDVLGVSSEAEEYRTKGYEAQQRGDIDNAIEWYQKAAGMKPGYASPHNDLGILYETKGWLDRAEAEYEKALALDPNYKEVYTNLALLYERKGELEKAAFYWMKRYKLGNPNDPWNREAKNRLEKLGLIDKTEQQAPAAVKKSQKEEKPKHNAVPKVKKHPDGRKPAKLKKNKEPVKDSESQRCLEKKQKPESKPKIKKDSGWTRIGSKKNKKSASTPKANNTFNKELQESLRLAEERLRKEKESKKNSKEEKIDVTSDSEANAAYNKAKDYYDKGEYAKALDAIRIVKQNSGQSSKSLSELEDEIKFKMKEERIADYYKEGTIRYRQKDFAGARKEFEAMLNILPE